METDSKNNIDITNENKVDEEKDGGKVIIDKLTLRKQKQLNPFISTDKPKEIIRKKKENKKTSKRKLKSIENALNRQEKTSVEIEKKLKKNISKKRWNTIY